MRLRLFRPAPPAEETVGLRLADGTTVDVRWVRDPRARRLRLLVSDRGPRLTLPPRASTRSALAFLEEHRDWLAAQLAKRPAPRPPFGRGHAGALPLRGLDVPLAWREGRYARAALGDECELRDPVDGGAVVRCTKHELQNDEIRKHLEAGKQASRLALVLDDHVSFVLGEDLVVRKLKFLDGAVDTLENTERDSLRDELDARFALQSGELHRLFAVLETALKFSRADG